VTTRTLDRSQVVFRRTHAHKGRHISITPANSATKHLSYGRIRLDAEVPEVAFDAGAEEVGLICFQGEATVTVDGQAFPMGRYDSMYIPRDSHIAVKSATSVDLVELRAPVEHRYPLRHVPYAEVKADPGLHFRAGGPASSRTLNMLIAKNVEAGRLMAGVTWSERVMMVPSAWQRPMGADEAKRPTERRTLSSPRCQKARCRFSSASTPYPPKDPCLPPAMPVSLAAEYAGYLTGRASRRTRHSLW
jgi:mannose-6-phosphate isomerase-like protein (cupin superfamily)